MLNVNEIFYLFKNYFILRITGIPLVVRAPGFGIKWRRTLITHVIRPTVETNVRGSLTV